MEDFLKAFFIDNTTQIWTIISVLVGGLATYITTTAGEKKKSVLEFQRRKLETVLVPYCTCLEETLEKIQLSDNEKDITDSSDFFETYEASLKKPSEYLKAAKRVYLSSKQRAELDMYANLVDQLIESLASDSHKCMDAYKNHLTHILKKFPGESASDAVSIYFMPKTSDYVKYALITQKEFSLKRKIQNISFYYDTDGPAPFSGDFSLKKDIRSFLSNIDWDIYGIDDIIPPEDKADRVLYHRAYEMLEYLDQNTTDETAFLNHTVINAKSPKLFLSIVDILNLMIADLTKNIDDITS